MTEQPVRLKVTITRVEEEQETLVGFFYIPEWADEDWAKRNGPTLLYSAVVLARSERLT